MLPPFFISHTTPPLSAPLTVSSLRSRIPISRSPRRHEGLRHPWGAEAAQAVPPPVRGLSGAAHPRLPRRPRRLAGPPPHQAQVLPPGRRPPPVQPHPWRRPPPHLRRPGHPLLPQPQRPHRRLLRPPRRLRPLQEPAGHRRHRPPLRLPGPQRRHRLDENAGYLLLYVRVDGLLRWKVGTWISGHYHLQANCPAFLTAESHAGVPPLFRFQQITACSVDV
ncbi:hypothetical protein MUK42_03506 [Musa troglodytarum]|uniref:Uncharacterized protein n=1 Tax=Musa troglodytarum TaxID=320322 RepID=A0A9E7KPU7_9LILI|nr:hypothetical protein MUK42_03506 [Musa troglodytarum]